MIAKDVAALARETYDNWRALGFSHEQVCGGPLGAQQRETSFRLPIIGDKRGSDPDRWAYGKFQWHWIPRGKIILSGDPDRHIKGCGIDIRSASNSDQDKAAWWELNNVEKRALAEIKAAKTLEEMASAWVVFYEKSQNHASDIRKQIRFGQAWAEKFKDLA